MDYYPVIAGDNSGACQPTPGTDAAPATSCKQLLQVTPKPPSGFYKLTAGNEVITAYCEMELEGGGWELLWRQVGGFLRTEHAVTPFRSNYELRQQADNTNFAVGPPVAGNYSTQVGAYAKR